MRRMTAPGSSKTGQSKAKSSRQRGGHEPKATKRTQQRNAGQRNTDQRNIQGKHTPSLILPTAKRVNAGQRQSQQQARRRRRTARQMRRFESLVERVPRVSAGKSLVGYGVSQWLESTHWRSSHLISFCLLILAIGGVGWLHYDEQWYVYREHVTFTNSTHQSEDELYELIDVDGWNVFWLSASSIHNRLVALPTINDAQVKITPPHWITIDIEESEPVALWVTQDGDYWLLPDGTALDKTDERFDQLPRIIDHLREASTWGDLQRQQIDPAVLASALALLQRVPAIDNLYFNAGYGLNFHMPESDTWVYWGDGSNAEQKYQNLLTIARDLRAQQEVANIVDIRFEKPVIK